jgi:hypothetical protein
MPGYSASPCSRLSLLYVTVALEFIPTSLRRIWIVAFKHQASQQDSMCFCPVTFEILNVAHAGVYNFLAKWTERLKLTADQGDKSHNDFEL